MEDHAADFFPFVVDVRNQASMHRLVYDVIICAWARMKMVPENAASQEWLTKDGSMHNLSEI